MRYRVIELIGKGGMGEVFLAEDTELERKVALKFLPEALQSDPTALARLRREAKSAAALDHPYICKVYEVGESEDGRAFIAMEYVAGETLAARMEREPLHLIEALGVAVEMVEALVKAHERGIVHRDLKPANVMLGLGWPHKGDGLRACEGLQTATGGFRCFDAEQAHQRGKHLRHRRLYVPGASER